MSIQSNIHQLLSLPQVLAGIKGMHSKKTDTQGETTAGTSTSTASSTADTRAKTKQAETRATEALQTEQDRKRKTRRNFLDYMKDEPTSLGVPFGQLSPSLQKALASDYSKSERRTIMDRKDTANEQK